MNATLLRKRTPSTPRRAPRRRLGRALERALVQRAAGGDRAALETLLLAHFPLAVREAAAHACPGLSTEDLVAEACVGLIEAVTRFDGRRGCRFMTYATWWMRRRVVEAACSQTRNVRIPRHRFAKSLQARTAPPREISLVQLPARDEPAAGTQAGEGVEADLLRHERETALHRALRALPARERRILVSRHGIGGAQERTLEDIAVELGVSKERVRQLEAQAVARLRARLARLG